MSVHKSSRKGSALRASVLLGLAFTLAPGFAAAATADDLQGVEKAYREIDFELARELAEQALRRGGHTLQATARLELLLGVANAALGKDSEARTAFVRLLAIDPNQKLDTDLSPRMRAPFLEARGFWSSNPGGLTASVDVEANALTVRLVDPVKMARTVRLSARAKGDSAFREADYPASEVLRLPSGLTRSADTIEIVIALLDEHGNVVHEQGSKTRPLQISAARGSLAPGAKFDLGEALLARCATGECSATSIEHRPNYLLSGALSLLGVTAVGTGVVFHVQRERAARKWNGSGCEQPGTTRAEQCGDVESQVKRDQWLAVGLYSAGGALITASVVTFLVGKGSSPEHRSAALACTPGTTAPLAVLCRGKF